MKFSFSRFESRSETANVSRRSSPAASASIAVKVGVLFLLSTASCPGQDGGPEFGHGLQILTGDARIEGSTNMTVGCCGSDSDSGYVGDQKSYVPSRRHDRGLPVTAKDSGVAVAITDCASAAVNYGAGASVHPGSVTTTAFLMGDTFGDYLCAIIDESFMEGESSGTWRLLCPYPDRVPVFIGAFEIHTNLDGWPGWDAQARVRGPGVDISVNEFGVFGHYTDGAGVHQVSLPGATGFAAGIRVPVSCGQIIRLESYSFAETTALLISGDPGGNSASGQPTATIGGAISYFPVGGGGNGGEGGDDGQGDLDNGELGT